MAVQVERGEHTRQEVHSECNPHHQVHDADIPAEEPLRTVLKDGQRILLIHHGAVNYPTHLHHRWAARYPASPDVRVRGVCCERSI